MSNTNTNCRACIACDANNACDACIACYACAVSVTLYDCNACYACKTSYACRACYACQQIKNSFFCYKIECAKNQLFNKQVSEERIEEVKNKCNKLRGDWLPYQTNGYQLYKEAGNDWAKIDISKLKTVDWYESWKDIPKELIAYLQSLPEWDAEIFKQITGLERID